MVARHIVFITPRTDALSRAQTNWLRDAVDSAKATLGAGARSDKVVVHDLIGSDRARKKLRRCLNQASKEGSDVGLFFVGHACEYHLREGPVNVGGPTVFSEDDADVSADTSVLAYACLSGRSLGEALVSGGRAKIYLGFIEAITFYYAEVDAEMSYINALRAAVQASIHGNGAMQNAVVAFEATLRLEMDKWLKEPPNKDCQMSMIMVLSEQLEHLRVLRANRTTIRPKGTEPYTGEE